MRLLGFSRPIRRYAVPYFLCALLYAVFNTANYAMIIPIMNTMFLNNYEFVPVYEMPKMSISTISDISFNDILSYVYTTFFGEEYSLASMLMLLAAIMITANLFSNLFRYLSAWTVENMRTRSVQRMRDELFSKVMDMHVGYFSDQRKGDIISKMTNDVGMVQFCITNTLQVAFRDPLLVVGYIALMISISWQLSLFAVLFLPLVALIIGSIVKRLRHPARTNQERIGEMVSTVDESLSGVKVIKSYTATGYVKRKFHELNNSISELTLSMARRQQLASPMSEFLGITAVSVLIVYGGILVADGKVEAAGFVTFIAAFSQITRPIRSFIDQFSNINQGIAAGERIFSVLDAESQVQDAPNAKTMQGFSDKIEVRDIRFSYDDSREIIKGVSFDVKRGETVALVGPSGGGKSTLSELIPRFYDVASGDILVDGVSIKEYAQESVRSFISVVGQDTILFNDTIEGNIGMGRNGATHDEIVAAAKVANAHNFIEEAPQGYDTNIGDRGVKLSGGQRQRLSIARAVLKNPEILILDEATSALDTESEKLVQEALNKLLKGRTSIVIAHRLSTIQNADKILVVDQGIIAEQGTHEQLVAKGGIYAKLIEMQSFE